MMAMKNMVYKVAVVVLAAALSAACNKKDSCKVSFPVSSVYLADWGQSATVSISTSNVKYLTVSSATNGWSAEADLQSRTITVTAPESPDAEDAASSSVISISASSPGGSISGAVLYAYITGQPADLSADGTHSNCYVITQPNTHYRFNAMLKGETNELLATKSVGIVWQSKSSLVKYLNLDDGYADFYVGCDDDDSNAVSNGNALVAAYDSAGKIIWSWHLWFTQHDPRTEDVATYSNGMTFMNCNLGAFANSDGSADTGKILASYGLYYQWGRKDPFMRPRYYDCAGNDDEIVYNAKDRYAYVTVSETDASKGTVEYAAANPTVFLSSPSGNRGDWLYGAGDNGLWGENAAKTENDPCPKGWRVPSKEAFSVLDIAESEDYMDLEEARKMFGWNLTDKGTLQKHFYTGAGYRSYFDGILSNINYKDQYPYTPVPWVGYYWTNASGAESTSCAMFFDLNTSRATVNAFDPISVQYRANAMQVRCVKE